MTNLLEWLTGTAAGIADIAVWGVQQPAIVIAAAAVSVIGFAGAGVTVYLDRRSR